MGLRDLLTKPLFGTPDDFTWHEPWLFRLRLHGDLGPRFLMGLTWTVALAAVSYVIALGEHERNPVVGPAVIGGIFGGFVGLVGALGILLAPEAAFGSRVRVNAKRIQRTRTTISFWHGLSVREWWEYAGLTCDVVPAAALGTKFTVLVLPRPRGASEKRSLVAVPALVDLDALLRCLAERGVQVRMAPELADVVRAQRPYGRGVATVVVVLGLVVAVGFAGYAAVRQNQRQAQGGPQQPPAVAAGAAAAPVGAAPVLAPKPKGLVREFSLPREAAVEAIALSDDGRRLLAGASRGRVFVFDPQRDDPVDEYVPHKSNVQTLAVAPDGTTAYSAESGGGALWDLVGQRELVRLPSVSWFPAPAAFSPDGRLAFFPDAKNEIVVYDVPGRRERFRLKAGSSRIEALAPSADGARLVSLDSLEIRYWDLSDGRATDTILRSRLDAHYGLGALAREGFAVFANPSQIRVWDVAQRGPAAVAIPGGAERLAVSGDGRLGFIGRKGTIAVWDLRRGVETAGFECKPDNLKQIVPSGDGRRVVTYDYISRKLLLWEPAAKQ